MMKKRSAQTVVILNILGVLAYVVGICSFSAPANIAPGGASGIGILVNYVTGFPIGVFSMLFNIPILLLGLLTQAFNPKWTLRLALTIIGMSIATDVIGARLPIYTGNRFLAALFAGACMGVGMACVYLGTSDTGGITLIGLILQRKLPYLKVGTFASVINMGIVLMSGVVYKDIDSIMYSIVTVYVSGLFMNRLIDNSNAKDMLIVMSECTDKVRCIFLDAHEGITVLKGEGGYTSETQRVIIGAAEKSQSMTIQRKITEVDPKALIIVSEATNVTGKSFGTML